MMMRLPPQLSRRKSTAHKNDFGHILILAGSRNLLGAAALTALAAMRSGAGLVTLGIPESLNNVVQKKVSSVVMTWPLKETKNLSLAASAYPQINKKLHSFDVVALGPGLSAHPDTQKLILKVIAHARLPLVIDADALNALSNDLSPLQKNKGIKILTPHPGEMSRLTNLNKDFIEKNRKKAAVDFAKKFYCTILLKGHPTVVAAATGEVYINQTGNPGMATAGSGDVLTGMIAAFLGQGLSEFNAAKYGAYLHGLAGDLAAREISQAALIAADIIDYVPKALRQHETSRP